MQRHSATARDGPLAGDSGLTVADQDQDGRWPSPVVWSNAGERHVYDLMALVVDIGLFSAPAYVFRRTLGSGESEPKSAWMLPPRYLM